MTTTRYDEMRLATCPGCSDPMESRYWDVLVEYDIESEEFYCDCGVTFEVARVGETMAVDVRLVE